RRQRNDRQSGFDHVLEEMLEGLGLNLRSVDDAFTPESGAYVAHSHTHEHAHADEHSATAATNTQGT
ncbi:MAG: hypothetical protein AAF098_18460, partial [Pseudomonadota bacterium]